MAANKMIAHKMAANKMVAHKMAANKMVAHKMAANQVWHRHPNVLLVYNYCTYNKDIAFSP